jgi:hypothetical protein
VAPAASHRYQRVTHGLVLRMRSEFTALLAPG